MTKLTDEERASRKIYNPARSAIRRAWLRWPDRRSCLLEARRAHTGHNKVRKWDYQCAECKEWYLLKEVQVDHVIPAGSFTEPSHHERFIVNMFLGKLQVLCTECHAVKTAEERRKK